VRRSDTAPWRPLLGAGNPSTEETKNQPLHDTTDERGGSQPALQRTHGLSPNVPPKEGERGHSRTLEAREVTRSHPKSLRKWGGKVGSDAMREATLGRPERCLTQRHLRTRRRRRARAPAPSDTSEGAYKAPKAPSLEPPKPIWGRDPMDGD